LILLNLNRQSVDLQGLSDQISLGNQQILQFFEVLLRKQRNRKGNTDSGGLFRLIAFQFCV